MINPNSLIGVILAGIIFTGIGSSAYADGACGFVVPKGNGVNGGWKCIDKVVGADTCDRLCQRDGGISAKFYPGKTCETVSKSNDSSTSVSMNLRVDEIAELVARTGTARANIAFKGEDRFTDRTVAGTSVEYTGEGVVLFSRTKDPRVIDVNADNVTIRLTGYRPGDVNPALAKQMAIHFRTAQIVRNIMRGTLTRVANGYEINLQQGRQISASGLAGWINSSGNGFVPIGAKSFQYKGVGVTMHSLLMLPE